MPRGGRAPTPSRPSESGALPGSVRPGVGPATVHVTEPSRSIVGEEPSADLVVLGEFGRAHGLRGEIRLKSYTADPKAIAGYGPLALDRGGSVVLTRVRQAAGDAPDLLVAVVEGVTTREGADGLNRRLLSVPRERLGAVADEDEFFLADLVGLSARAEDGAEIGQVVAVPNFGGGDLLEIRPAAGGPTYLLPFTRAIVPAIDIRGGTVTVREPSVEPGALDDD